MFQKLLNCMISSFYVHCHDLVITIGETNVIIILIVIAFSKKEIDTCYKKSSMHNHFRPMDIVTILIIRCISCPNVI